MLISFLLKSVCYAWHVLPKTSNGLINESLIEFIDDIEFYRTLVYGMGLCLLSNVT